MHVKMSEDLNDTLSLQNIITLQLISSLQQTQDNTLLLRVGFQGMIITVKNLGLTFTNLTNVFATFTPSLKGDLSSLRIVLKSMSTTLGDTSRKWANLVGTVSGPDFLGKTDSIKATGNKAFLGGLSKSITGLTKSMLSATLVMKPTALFLSELLDPVEIVTATIGVMGSLISVGLIPGLNTLNSVLLPFLPIIQFSLPLLTFVIRGMTRPLEAIAPILEGVSGALTSIKNAGFREFASSFLNALRGNTLARERANALLERNTDELERRAETAELIAETGGFVVKESRFK